jgi:hypothetical protein
MKIALPGLGPGDRPKESDNETLPQGVTIAVC